MKENNKKSFIGKLFAESNRLKFILISVVIGFIVGGIAIALAGFNPFQAYGLIFNGIFSRPKYIAWSIVRSTPIIFTGLGVAFAFKTGTFNIGAEGQYIVGAIVAAILGYVIKLPLIIHVPLILVGAMFAGMVWGGVAGYLKSKFGVNEVISTIMLNWIALYLNNYLAYSKTFHQPNSETTYPINQSAIITLFHGSKDKLPDGLRNFFSSPVNLGFILAIITAILIWIVLNKTSLGYGMKAVGLNPDASEYGGINVRKNLVASMGISGAICALGGATQVMGVSYAISNLNAMEGYGFDGIAVALLANNNPIGAIFSGLFFGALKYSGANVQRVMHAPYEMIQIIIGTIILFTAMPLLFKVIKARIDKRRKS